MLDEDIDLTEDRFFEKDQKQKVYPHKSLPWDSKGELKRNTIDFIPYYSWSNGLDELTDYSSWITTLTSRHSSSSQNLYIYSSSSDIWDSYTTPSISYLNNKYKYNMDVTGYFGGFYDSIDSKRNYRRYGFYLGDSEYVKNHTDTNKEEESKYQKYMVKDKCKFCDEYIISFPWDNKMKKHKCKINDVIQDDIVDPWSIGGIKFTPVWEIDDRDSRPRKNNIFGSNKSLFTYIPTLSNDIKQNYKSPYEVDYGVNTITEYYNTFPEYKYTQFPESKYNSSIEKNTGKSYYINEYRLNKESNRRRNRDMLQPDGRESQPYDDMFNSLQWRDLLKKRLKLMESKI